jgi:hypothetical protein
MQLATRTGDTAPVSALGNSPSSEQADSTPHIVEVGPIVGPRVQLRDGLKPESELSLMEFWQSQSITTARLECAIKRVRKGS